MTEYTKLHNIFKRIGWEEVEGFSELHKIFIIEALAQDIPLMFLDEPTSALDFQNQMRIWEIMREIAEEGKTILACSHDPNHVAWFCDRVVVMADGAVISNGRPKEVITEEMLDRIYKNTCTVRSMADTQMVIPRCIAARDCSSSEEMTII